MTVGLSENGENADKSRMTYRRFGTVEDAMSNIFTDKIPSCYRETYDTRNEYWVRR